MYSRVQTIFWGLSIFLLSAGLFLLQPSKIPETTVLQDQIQHQFIVAWQQTIGDQPYFDDFGLIYDGVTAFYSQSASATISLIRQPESDAALAYIFKTTYQDFVVAIKGAQLSQKLAQTDPQVLPPGKFMTEQAIYNIVPEQKQEARIKNQGQVAGVSVQSGNPVNSVTQPWVTIQDNFTGQIYCLAVYNGDVNKYLGPCKYDYH